MTLPEGEMREKIRERFDRDNIICEFDLAISIFPRRIFDFPDRMPVDDIALGVTLVNADGEVGVESFTEGTGK